MPPHFVKPLHRPEKIIHRLQTNGLFRIGNHDVPGLAAAPRKAERLLEVTLGVFDGRADGLVAVFGPALGDTDFVTLRQPMKLGKERAYMNFNLR